MANNRSYLCCVNCLLDPNKEVYGDEGCIHSLFKYYPNTGWYIMAGDADEQKICWFDSLNTFLDKHKDHWHDQKSAMYGQFIMIFETQFEDDFILSKNIIMDKLIESGALR